MKSQKTHVVLWEANGASGEDYFYFIGMKPDAHEPLGQDMKCRCMPTWCYKDTSEDAIRTAFSNDEGFARIQDHLGLVFITFDLATSRKVLKKARAKFKNSKSGPRLPVNSMYVAQINLDGEDCVYERMDMNNV